MIKILKNRPSCEQRLAWALALWYTVRTVPLVPFVPYKDRLKEKRIGMAKAREGLADLINEVAYGGERYVVERRGKPLAALIGVDEYRQLTELLAESGVNAEVRGIPVRIRYDGELYFVNEDRLDLYGAGATLQEARED